MRIYYPKGYFSISATDITEVPSKEYKVQKHLIRKQGSKKYYSGKLYLPSNIIPFDEYNKREYQLIDLKYPCYLRNKGHYRECSFVFVKKHYASDSSFFNIKISSRLYSLNRGLNKFHAHTRKSKNKIYKILKIFMPKNEIGTKTYIMKLKSPVRIEYYDKRFLVFDSDKRIQNEIGDVFIIFKKRNHSYIEKIKSSLKHRKRYEDVLELIDKGKYTLEIADILSFSETNVWKHIAQSYKEGAISIDKLIKILKENSSLSFKDQILIMLESMKKKVEKDLNMTIDKYSLKEWEIDKYRKEMYRDEFTIHNIRRIYKELLKIDLVPNLVECILIIYKKILNV